jgi:molecular chaperone DnaK (HSP70)
LGAKTSTADCSTISVFGFAKDHKIDLRQDRTALQRLRDAVEKAKCDSVGR